jgi:preprotein translocase SecF subunit
MRDLFPRTSQIDFLGKGKFFIIFSTLTIIGSLYLWLSKGGSAYGVDFLGGHDFVVEFSEKVDSSTVSQLLEKNGIDDGTVQSFEASSNQLSVRLSQRHESKDALTKLTSALNTTFKDKYKIVRTDFVGPTVGKELRRKALIAVSLGLVAILIYVAIRFEFAFALGAVVALFHDVVVSLGVYLLAGHTITMGTLAAALTIVGYSVNDTIIIFDRVREELRKGQTTSLSSLVNGAINSTLSRTIVTQLLTTFSIVALLIFGGGAISDLSLFLFAGMITGTYSTMYIASPVMIAWHKFRGGSETV